MRMSPATGSLRSWLALLHAVDVGNDASRDSLQAFHQHVKKQRLETVHAETPFAFLLPFLIQQVYKGVGIVIFRFCSVTFLVKQSVLHGLQRQEIQTVALCRIVTPESGGCTFRILVPQFKGFEVFLENAFEVCRIESRPVRRQVSVRFRKQGNGTFQ